MSIVALAALTAASGLTIAVLNRAPLQATTRVSPATSFSGTEVPRGGPRPGAPAPARVATLANAGPCVDVPILLYHYIRVDANPRDQVGWGLSVTPAEFRAEMDWLRRAGGHTVTPTQLIDALDGGPALPPRAVVLTFDDGYADFATAALPVLIADGFVATDFVVSGFIGRSSYMTAAQVVQADHDGMIIGAHTVDHVDLTALSTAAAAAEIDVSRATLQRLLGHPVRDFAYPYGDVNAAVAGLVAAAGFSDAVSTSMGTVQCSASRYLLHRTRVGGGDTVWSFAAKAGVQGPPRGWQDASPV
jgi:peptidoglycan/xylan/chitin deacetylase (PgdA/CDA1 family)